MSKDPFHSDEPSQSSVSLLVSSLRSDRDAKGVSPKNCAHRLRVIRQQKGRLARKVAGDAEETGARLAKLVRKASRCLDHRDEGGQG